MNFMITQEKSPADSASDREIVMSRVIYAPRELVWQAWTELTDLLDGVEHTGWR